MNPRALARLILLIAFAYDGILGAAFLFAAPTVFSWCAIPAPTHWGYVHFGAAVLLIFALMFLAAAASPGTNRNLISFGMLLKLAYVGVVSYHWANGDVPLVFRIFLFLDAAWFVVLGWTIVLASRKPKAADGDTASAPAAAVTASK